MSIHLERSSGPLAVSSAVRDPPAPSNRPIDVLSPGEQIRSSVGVSDGKDNMTARRAAVIAAASGPAAILVGDLFLGPIGALAIVGVGVAIGWRFVPDFWRTFLRAAIAGGFAGVLVLGPGYRLAMRIVAILDESTTPEFTIEGTMFLVVGIGLVFGGITTTWVTLITKTYAARRPVAVSVLTVVVISTLFLDSEVFRELTDLGLGPVVNVPMFLGVTVGWAWLADRWARPTREPLSADAELVPVP